MKEVVTYVSESPLVRSRLGLVGCDERAIVCAQIPGLVETIAQAGVGVVLAMPEAQYHAGLRGFVKAKILAQVCDVAGVLPVSYQQMQKELERDWKSVQVVAPMMWQTDEVVSAKGRKMEGLKIGITTSAFDQMAMDLAVQMVETSNCWLDPAGCVFAKERTILVQSASTRLADFDCPSLPFTWKESGLKEGERMLFCDSLHAERTGISLAAKQGITLAGSTMYVSKFPCRQCSLNAIEAGVRRVVFERDSYGIAEAADLYRSHKIVVERIQGLREPQG